MQGTSCSLKAGSQERGALPGSDTPYANTTPTSELVPRLTGGRGVQDAVEVQRAVPRFS